MNWFDSRFEMAFPSQPSAWLANRWPNIPKRVFDQKFFPTFTAGRGNCDSSIDSRALTAAFAFGAVCKARCTRDRRITARASKSSTDWKLWIACLAALPGSLQYGFGLSVLACRGCWTWIFLHVLRIFCMHTWSIYMFCSTQYCHFNVVFFLCLILFGLPGGIFSNYQKSGAINVPQASICRSLHLPQNSFTWSALVAILSPAGLFGAWLAPLAVSRLGIFGFQFSWNREFSSLRFHHA